MFWIKSNIVTLFCFLGLSQLTIQIIHAESVCKLTIDSVIVGDCEYSTRTGNASKVLVAVFFTWTMPPANSKIVVRVKGQSKQFDPTIKGCPHYVQFVLDPDGSNQMVDAYFNNLGNCAATSVPIKLPLPCDPPACQGKNSIGGQVFNDFNNNGKKDLSENGLQGIQIKIYDDLKIELANTLTASNGAWATSAIPAGKKVRVEFIYPPNYYESVPGINSKGRTQKTSTGNCAVDLGLVDLETIIDVNPWIVTAAYSKGNASDTNTVTYRQPSLIANLFNVSEGGPRTGPDGNYYLASCGETGSLWGIGYQRETRTLFSSSFLKRNADLGKYGLGAIYYTGLADFVPIPRDTPGYRYYGRTNLLVNFDSFGIATGNEALLKRNLPLNNLDASHDSVAFDLVGKWGLGDLDLNDNGDSLFVVNLYNRSVIVVNIGNPLTLPITSDRIHEFAIPDPGCSDSSEWRPWALKYYDGVLYVGGICSAEKSQNRDDLKAVIYTFSNGVFNKLLEFDLNYGKGFINGNDCSLFRPWSNNFYTFYQYADIACGPEPAFTDMEFDSYGNIIVALGDRFGYQTGGRDYGTRTSDKTAYVNFSGGDLLKLFKLKNVYLLEQNGTSGFTTTAGANNNQGICGGEFYYQDGFFSHQESVLGGLALHPSYNTVIATLMDPAQIWSNGWSQIDNSLGTKRANYNIYTGEKSTFGKSSGLGDVEILNNAKYAQVQGVAIGNYIWEDRDADGMQDPGEDPVAGMPVYLFDNGGFLLNNTITNAAGEYVFTQLQPSTSYIIQIGNDNAYQSRELIHGRKIYTPTVYQVRTGFANSENDSDASYSVNSPGRFQDKITLTVKTGASGQNNFSYDFGLITCRKVIPGNLTYNLCPGDSIQVLNDWYGPNKMSGNYFFPGGSFYGCDSSLTVQIKNIDGGRNRFDTSVCYNSDISINGLVFNKNHQIDSVLFKGMASNGCDSVLVIRVQILDSTVRRLDTVICPGKNLVILNTLFDSLHTSETLRLAGGNRLGCDSLIQVQLGFFPRTVGSFDTSLCRGEQLILHNIIFDETHNNGSLTLMQADRFGCDSSVQITLRYLNPGLGNLDTSLCPGHQLTLGGVRFDDQNPKGNVLLKGANYNGCDSMISVNLSFFPRTAGRLDSTVCQGSYIIIEGTRFDKANTSGDLVLANRDIYGCDSTLTVNLSFHPETKGKIDTATCEGGEVVIQGIKLNQSNPTGKLVLSQSSYHGCDSIVTLNLKIHPAFHKKDSIQACHEYYWDVNGNTYTEDGEFEYRGQTVHGCDSIYLLKLKVYPDYTFVDSVCTLNRYYWKIGQKEYRQSGVYDKMLTTRYGCDSLRILILEILGEGEVFVPNVFSPNGDGINDKISVYADKDVHLIDVFRIFDRWGEMMYENTSFPPNDPNIGWDGNLRGTPVRPAVFAYYLEWTDKLGGKHKDYGDVTLVR